MAVKDSFSVLKELSQLSYTPLIDLAMLLLVTFIITYPLIEQGVHINLPAAETEEIAKINSRTISIDQSGSVFFESSPVTTAELAAKLKRVKNIDSQITVYLRADKDLKYDRVMQIIQILHDAKINKMALITQEK
jgi:biopolymer transport protein TolR